MRRSQDLPVDRPRRRFTGRGILISLGGLFMFVLIFGRAIARFYVDYLWHDALDRGDVFWGVIGAKFTLFAIFFLFFACWPASTSTSQIGLRPRRSRRMCIRTSNDFMRSSASDSASFATPRPSFWVS